MRKVSRSIGKRLELRNQLQSADAITCRLSHLAVASWQRVYHLS